MFADAEFLILGVFKEDDTDDGYKGTMWVSANDLLDRGEEFNEHLSEFEAMIVSMREQLFPEDDDE